MYQPRAKLYVLYGKNSILAISDEERNIKQYYLQFKSYFDKIYSRVDIISVVSKNKISEIMAKHFNTHWLYWLTDEIILTDIEHQYYTKQLRKMYSDTKNMMSQLLILNKFTNFSPKIKKNLMDTFEITYDSMKSYEDFLGCIDSREFFTHYISTPDVTKEVAWLDAMRTQKLEMEDYET